MTSAYWAQFSQVEIDEMHGVETCHDDDQDDCNFDREESEECGCGNCMDCLGMSWRDFF